MRYLARNITGDRPLWWTANGWGKFADATIFNSSTDAAETINGSREIDERYSYNLEIYGGKN